jgi:RNA polymerase sigma-70 factor (ECF subfamily)
MTALDEQDRFLALLEEHDKILYKVASSYCRDPEDRRDLTQEIVVQLWRSFGRSTTAIGSPPGCTASP